MNFIGVNFSIHKEGYRFIAIGIVVSLIFMLFSSVLTWIAIILTAFCVFFFRNPKRIVPNDQNLITSPADGTVVAINYDVPPQELNLGEEKRYKVSIFLSLLNVHINRLPASGKIKNIIYQPGSFLNASLDKASVFNEKNTIILELNDNLENLMAFNQIAGFIARRIVCDVHEGQEVKKGDIFGLIRFGSRCDIWLPLGAVPEVIVGQTMLAGETVISDLSRENSSLREGTSI